MSDPFVAEIRMAGFNFAPRNWAFCAGQLLLITQNTALFSLLGTTYGGDGRATFALPDFEGRAPMGVGEGPGLSERLLGDTGGSETFQPTIVGTASNPPAPITAFSFSTTQGSAMPPYLALNFIVAMQGVFPQRP